MNDDLLRLERWTTLLRENLGTPDQTLDRESIHILLDLARDAAHQVVRAASPLTLFLVGVAVGRGETLGKAAAIATQLALNYEDFDYRGLLEAGETEEGPVVGDVSPSEFPAESDQ